MWYQSSMNGVHDLGGMDGFGPVDVEANEPVFHQPWEGRVWGMMRQVRALPGKPAGRMRPVIESMEPARYLTASYYERFLHAVETAALEKGVVAREELADRVEFLRSHPEAPLPRRVEPAAAAGMLGTLRTQAKPEADGPPPRFKPGDPVAARNLNPQGHTRLPRYIRGKRGVIVRVNGWYRLQDDEVERLGPNPQTVYTVRFAGSEVWGPAAEPNLSVHLEMWEGYLDEWIQ